MRTRIYLCNKRWSRNLKKNVSEGHQAKRFKNKIIVLMAMPHMQVIIATLNEPESYGEKGNFALVHFNACTANPLIVIAPLTMASYQSDLAEFNRLQAAMAEGLHTTTELRNNAWKLVKTHLLACMAVAQSNSNDAPLLGIEIIQSGSFGIKHVPEHEAHIFRAKNVGPGSLYIEAAGAGITATNDWEVSYNGILWTSFLSTHKAHMTAKGLTQVTKVWLRHRARIDDEDIPEWELIYVTVI